MRFRTGSRWFVGLALLLASSVQAEESYRVTLVRAAPGNLPAVLDQAAAYKAEMEGRAVLMRHSQGDHWDLMLLEPAGDSPLGAPSFAALADFEESFLASSESSWTEIAQRSRPSDLFHIEMFHAAAGKKSELLEQRAMENVYLTATGREPNAIFVTTFGSDVDCFTVGFYKDMTHFAASPDLPDEAFEEAARQAGFKERGDIGFHLRRLIVAHQDTLATQVAAGSPGVTDQAVGKERD